MANCARCGASIGDGIAFCGSCGAPAGAGATSWTQQPASTGLESNVAGLLAYVFGFITGIIFLVVEPYKNDSFVRFHALQSIFFNVAVIVFWIAWTILSTVLSFATLGTLAVLMGGLAMLIGLAIMAFWIFLMVKAYQRQRYMIPFIGPLAAAHAR
jgi:uncharacterized membrane protein